MLSLLTVGALSLTQCVTPVERGYRGGPHRDHDDDRYSKHDRDHDHDRDHHGDRDHDHDRDRDRDHDDHNHGQSSYRNSQWKKGNDGYGSRYNNNRSASWQGASVNVYGGSYRN